MGRHKHNKLENKREAIWQNWEPNRRVCSLCGVRGRMTLFERATGTNAQLQSWPVCSRCLENYAIWNGPIRPDVWEAFVRKAGLECLCKLKVPRIRVG